MPSNPTKPTQNPLGTADSGAPEHTSAHKLNQNVGSSTEKTRLAPSPTGALHLGNARTFLITWALARQRGWEIILRLEDLDGPRIKPGAAQQCIDTLAWLGMDWDNGPIVQSEELMPHIQAMRLLADRGFAYPCELTRSQIAAAASAPHPSADSADDNAESAAGEPPAETLFPPSLRPAGMESDPPNTQRIFADTGTNWRLLVPDTPISFLDKVAGETTINPARTIGDFVIWTRRQQPSYQLAVVVDDCRQGITQVVRGDDLLDSAARQILLHDCLGSGPIPTYTHLPLVLGPDGRRLAKRHGDTRIETYRRAGCSPERLIGLMAAWCGIIESPQPMSATDFCQGFSLDTLARAPVICTKENDQWLRR